jgi:hypothetical protein
MTESPAQPSSPDQAPESPADLSPAAGGGPGGDPSEPRPDGAQDGPGDAAAGDATRRLVEDVRALEVDPPAPAP